ncbi:hypothetical protein G6F40_016803 [Rhizopus arrhizus]|nr:hypothetical protein G6F40_016803 [Rhizopus arrhizus]
MQVRGALDTLMRHRTTLVIAHRLSTIRGADLIRVLARGALAAQLFQAVEEMLAGQVLTEQAQLQRVAFPGLVQRRGL